MILLIFSFSFFATDSFTSPLITLNFTNLLKFPASHKALPSLQLYFKLKLIRSRTSSNVPQKIYLQLASRSTSLSLILTIVYYFKKNLTTFITGLPSIIYIYTSKNAFTCLSTKKPSEICHNYTIDNHRLERVFHMKDLDIIYDSTFTFD